MDKKEDQLVQQDAPLKNTDRAFVQVGKDGEPVIPASEEKPEQGREDTPATEKARQKATGQHI